MYTSHATYNPSGNQDSHIPGTPKQNPRIYQVGQFAIKSGTSPDARNVNSNAFLIESLRSVRISLGKNLTFTLDEFFNDKEIQAKARVRLQEILAKRINRIWAEIKRTGGSININVAVQVVNIENSNVILKIFKEICKIRGVDLVYLGDSHAFFSFSAKISNAYEKWKKGEIHIDLFELFKSYFSIEDMMESAYDLVSSTNDLVGLLDNNQFTSMAYNAFGYGADFSPFAESFVSIISSAHDQMAPIRIYLKCSAFYNTGRKWMAFDTKSHEENTAEQEEELNKIRRKFFKSILDVTRESVKLLSLAGLIPASPYTITVCIATLSISSLSLKFYNKNMKSAPAAA